MRQEEVKRRLFRRAKGKEAYENPKLRLKIAKAVLESRTRRSMKQEELASALNTSQMQIWRIESGQGNPTLKTLENLIDVLGLQVDIRIPDDDQLPEQHTKPEPVTERSAYGNHEEYEGPQLESALEPALAGMHAGNR